MATLTQPFRGLYRGWYIVFAGYLSQLATIGAFGFVFGVLILPMQSDLGWSRAEVVGVVTVSRLIGGVTAMFLGPIADRHGVRELMTVSAALAGVCLIGTSFAESKTAYYASWAVFGLAIPGLTNVGPSVAVSNWFIRKRAQAVMFYTFGAATAGVALAPLMSAIASEFGWRTSWQAMALLFFAIAPLAWLWVRRRPEDLGLRPDGDGPIDDAPQAGTPRIVADVEPEWTVREAMHSRQFWLLTFAFMLTSFPAASIFIHMSSFVESKGFSTTEAAAAVSIYGVGALCGRFLWGFLTSRIGVQRALVCYGFGYGSSIFLFVFPSNLIAIYLTTVLLGLGIAGAQQLQVQAYPEYFGRKIVGTLFGYANVITAMTGATAPLIAAAAYDRTESYSATFIAFGVFCLMAGVAFLFSKPRAPSTA